MNINWLTFVSANPIVRKILKVPIYGFVFLYMAPMLLLHLAQLVSDVSVASKEWLPVKIDEFHGQPDSTAFSYSYQFSGKHYRSQQVHAGFVERGNDILRVQQEFELGVQTAYVNINHPSEAALSIVTDIPSGLVGTITLLIPTLLLFFFARSLGREKSVVSAHEGISSQEKQEVKKNTVKWLLITAFAFIFFSDKLKNIANWDSGAFLIPLLIISLVLMMLLKSAWHWRRFNQIGQTPLQLSTFPLDVQTGIAASFELQGTPVGEMTATLRCLARGRYQQDSDSSGQSFSEESLWQEQRLCDATVQASGKTTFLCQFNPPKDSPASSTLMVGGFTLWRLSCSGTINRDGKDVLFERSWELTVKNSAVSQPVSMTGFIELLQDSFLNGASPVQPRRDTNAVDTTATLVDESAPSKASEINIEQASEGEIPASSSVPSMLAQGHTASRQQTLKGNAEYAEESVGRWVSIEPQQGGLIIRQRSKLFDGFMLPFLLIPMFMSAVILNHSDGDISWGAIAFIALFGCGVVVSTLLVRARRRSVFVKKGELQANTYWFGRQVSRKTMLLNHPPEFRVKEGGRSSRGNKMTVFHNIDMYYQGSTVRLLSRIGSYQDCVWITNKLTEQLTGEAQYHETSETSLAGQDMASKYSQALEHYQSEIDESLVSNLKLRPIVDGLEVSSKSNRNTGVAVIMACMTVVVLLLFGPFVGFVVAMPCALVAITRMGISQVGIIRSGRAERYYSIMAFKLRRTEQVLLSGCEVDVDYKPMLGIQSDVGYVTLILKQQGTRFVLLTGYATLSEARQVASQIQSSPFFRT